MPVNRRANHLNLSYNIPLEAVFLRIVSWEKNVARRTPNVNEIVTQQIEEARHELGLPRRYAPRSGGPHRFLGQLRTKGLLSPQHTVPTPIEKEWSNDKTAWRLWYVPSHSSVRQLSAKPVYEILSDNECRVTLRDPATPHLRLTIGTNKTMANICNDHRGVYYLNYGQSLYVGQTDEFSVRYSDHIRTKGAPIWWVFMTIEDGQNGMLCPIDVIDGAEGLLISLWNEVCELRNTNRGSDRKPTASHLQHAVLLAKSAAACMLWLVREQVAIGDKLGVLPASWKIPFRRWPGIQGWPGCYMKPPAA